MFKQKTHSGSSKRFKKTSSGLVKARHSGMRHILTKKSNKRKRNLGKGFYLTGPAQRKIGSVL